ncbi:Hsp20/alpha crystallin family protein [Patescibacteria group bacterium]|nr:Hsp20/alpha crystallin family protein [Patescibacteria group bacterium]
MAHDDQVAHFFGGRNDTQTPPAKLPQDEDGFGIAPETDAESGLDGEIAVDVFETDTDVVIVSPVAGVNPEEIEIGAGENSITITGKREAAHTERKHGLITQEIYWGSFSRAVQLPVGCDAANAVASFKHGVLTVKVPKTEQAKKKTITVKTEE